MGPVLGDQPVRMMQRARFARVVGAKAAPEDGLMRPGNDTNRVELHAAERANHLQQAGFLHGGIATRAGPAIEPRSDRGQPPGLGDGERSAGSP